LCPPTRAIAGIQVLKYLYMQIFTEVTNALQSLGHFDGLLGATFYRA
jgi:hypothetical protein